MFSAQGCVSDTLIFPLGSVSIFPNTLPRECIGLYGPYSIRSQHCDEYCVKIKTSLIMSDERMTYTPGQLKS